ncbi:MAG: HEAT repeat domain-containing protein [Gammaproteobacteria bacterium]|nr:HEAT repeat domain-containing protein [Gammaproteobacteria bacterium]MDH3466699.1 HEAT repeat domain-containing protein [Gammaproteobacteria bacterium]
MIARRSRSLAFLLIALTTWASSAAELDELQSVRPDSIQIHVQEGFLTLEAYDAPLATLLQIIGEEAGFDVVIEGDLSMTVNSSFTVVPLDRALRRLLDGISFMFFEYSGSTKRLDELWVFAAVESGGEQTFQPKVTTVEEPSQADMETWILDRLTSPQRGARIVAVRRLARLEPEVAARIAIQVLESEADAVVRGQAAAMLGKIGGDEASRLLELALADEEASVRRHAIQALRAIGAEQATTILGRVLTEDPDQEIRLMALETLIEASDDTSQYYLALAATDSNETIRQIALQALQANTTPSTNTMKSKEDRTQEIGM